MTSNRDCSWEQASHHSAPLLRHVLRRKGDFGQLVVLYGARTPDDFCYSPTTHHISPNPLYPATLALN